MTSASSKRPLDRVLKVTAWPHHRVRAADCRSERITPLAFRRVGHRA